MRLRPRDRQGLERLRGDYLRGRRNLHRVYVMVDARHGLKAADLAMLDTLDKAAVSYQVILTKVDEVKAKDMQAPIA